MNAQFSISTNEFEEIKTFIYEKMGIQLADHKKQLVITRLSRRLREFNFTTFSQYINYIKHNDSNGQELEQFINRISTNKTHFFRENIHFERLHSHILPSLPKKQIHIWCGAASTGEEPYSLAMTLHSYYESQSIKPSIMLTSSDIDTEVLQKANEGIYLFENVDGIDATLLKKYFLRGENSQNGKVKIKNFLKAFMEFKQINLIDSEYPFQEESIDVVILRNVLIYFGKEMKRKIINKIIPYLKPKGYFIFGLTDSVLGLTASLINLNNSIYQKPN